MKIWLSALFHRAMSYIPMYVRCFKSRIRSSTYTENNKEDRTSPCLTPHNITIMRTNKIIPHNRRSQPVVPITKQPYKINRNISLQKLQIIMQHLSNAFEASKKCAIYFATFAIEAFVASLIVNNACVNNVQPCCFWSHIQDHVWPIDPWADFFGDKTQASWFSGWGTASRIFLRLIFGWRHFRLIFGWIYGQNLYRANKHTSWHTVLVLRFVLP